MLLPLTASFYWFNSIFLLVSWDLRNDTPKLRLVKMMIMSRNWGGKQKYKPGELEKAKYTKSKGLVSTLQKTKIFSDHATINLYSGPMHHRNYRNLHYIHQNVMKLCWKLWSRDWIIMKNPIFQNCKFRPYLSSPVSRVRILQGQSLGVVFPAYLWYFVMHVVSGSVSFLNFQPRTFIAPCLEHRTPTCIVITQTHNSGYIRDLHSVSGRELLRNVHWN